METLPTAAERQHLVSSFLEIAVGENDYVATQFLELAGWKLEESVLLFLAGSENGGVVSASLYPPIRESFSAWDNVLASNSLVQGAIEDEVRPPLPVKRDILYGEPSMSSLAVTFSNFDEESKRVTVWNSEKNAASTANGSCHNLASLYKPPFALSFQGSFDQAKVEASSQSKWLLINLQSDEEFSSHMLNRDTWSNEVMAQTIRTNFIFWQMDHDTNEGMKVCTYYNLITLPAVLVIDPITGQKMRAWNGMVHPERLLEDLLPFLDKDPNFSRPKRQRVAHYSALANVQYKNSKDELEVLQTTATLEDTEGIVEPLVTDDKSESVEVDETGSNGRLSYPALPDEPTGSRDLCRIAIRLPDGRRIRRNFLQTDSTKLLWSFCSLHIEDGQKRPFHFTRAIPAASKSFEYEGNSTFEAAALSNSMITLIWDWQDFQIQ